jgi:ribosome-associated translation inhibitor RaiA
MHYNLELNDISLSDQARNMIDTRIGLDLSRFAGLISDFDIYLSQNSQKNDKPPVACTIKITLQAGHQIVVEDTATDLDAGFTQAVMRSKRAIERHLKRHRGHRLGSSVTSRT